MLEITADECRAHGLPPIHLVVDDTGLYGSRFPRASIYLYLSGPPGGPDSVSIEVCKTLKKWLAKVHPQAEAVQHTEVELAGQTRPAAAFLEGAGHARACHTAVWVGPVVVDFFCGAGSASTPDPRAALLRHETVVGSLAVAP